VLRGKSGVDAKQRMRVGIDENRREQRNLVCAFTSGKYDEHA
jgi:hypothetical protein